MADSASAVSGNIIINIYIFNNFIKLVAGIQCKRLFYCDVLSSSEVGG